MQNSYNPLARRYALRQLAELEKKLQHSVSRLEQKCDEAIKILAQCEQK